MLNKGIKYLHNGYRNAQFSPLEVFEQTIEFINRPEVDKLNAFNYKVTADNEEAAMQAMESAIRYKQRDQLSPLDGVPITFKDNYLVK